jgi:biopolymer transport protein ExbB
MIGLLGTVTGMILLFAEIHAADAFPGARIVADKIAVALITTFWGLAVAIPSLSIYGVFRNRIDVLTAECALTVEQLLNVFKPGSQQAAATAERPATATPQVKSDPPPTQSN